MSIILFAGPTISRAEIHEQLEADVRPPAQMGDIYLAAQSGPSVIGLIDGYFQGVPSVWHKEILWAIDQGIAVFGASSMGALRAAELFQFGMTGIGSIFEAFRDGLLHDDDEVAVLHGPAELGYPSLCEPMVNIRATLKHAVAEEILDDRTATCFIDIAKSTYYPDRNWDYLFDKASQLEEMSAAGHALREWLSTNRVDQKREDALSLLDAISEEVSKEPKPSEPKFAFEWTVMWDRLVRTASASSTEATITTAVLDELRLQPAYYVEIKRKAVGRFLISKAGRGSNKIDPAPLPEILRNFKEQRGLYSTRQLKSWCEENGLDEAGLRSLLEEEAHMDGLGRHVVANAPQYLLSELRTDGTYHALANRVNLKSEHDCQPDSRATNGQDSVAASAGLRLWYFESCLKVPLPENMDEHLRKIDIEDQGKFDSMVAREYAFRQSSSWDELKAD
ncbi:TfuA-like protein [Roseibium sp. SCPC15]|uniref:TfuA-like protein n=1 Tax=Roseibium sp. SCP15 TaxID=3141376 RepID=UPI00333DE5EA